MKELSQTLRDSPFHEMFEAYGCYRGNGFEYISTHLQRYTETMDLVPARDGIEILELGAAPFAFTLMLKHRMPNARIVLTQLQDEKSLGSGLGIQTESDFVLDSRSSKFETLHFTCAWFNMERDRWPFPDRAFDAVIGMEILEHLVSDPCFAFREANRVLRRGGAIIVTTPNIACYQSVGNLLDCRTPYTYGVYSNQGAYGRHNREYVPDEVVLLGGSSGFRTEVLTTRDVYPAQGMTLTKLAVQMMDLLRKLRGNRVMRGQTIFYRGVSITEDFGPYPVELYEP